MQRHDTQNVLINATTEAVIAYVSNGSNLPRWAIGFAKTATQATSPNGDENTWNVTTGAGTQIPTTIRTNVTAGTVDFVMSPAPGVTATAWSRSVEVAEGAMFSFTQIQAPGMPDELFQAQVDALGHELVTLKALLEIECPL